MATLTCDLLQRNFHHHNLGTEQQTCHKNHSQAVCPPEDGHPSSSNRALDIVDRDHTPRRHETKQTDDVGPPYSRTKSFAARMWARQEQL